MIYFVYMLLACGILGHGIFQCLYGGRKSIRGGSSRLIKSTAHLSFLPRKAGKTQKINPLRCPKPELNLIHFVF
ncbi:uncharacterized protein BYT42DRAFT_131170 [Radiomyces spectabilis]|uniref:uncharacterized protein n=1 Tax=Radiomyces spectabilis TaxID=64574 RepID=UPI0022206413|nr:uncharacterized protein BYT42DRAFT_131170 [Radiomyces spectabilis]KAI8367568.1 hypothetical protein BYT42DRAFT_131170 [Radiomyces spectabilis]